MGVVHFAGLGRSPGAVTSGLSYLKHEIGPTFTGGKIVESLVIFTSEEVIIGKEQASAVKYNDYMGKGVLKQWPDKTTNALEIVSEFRKREFPESDAYYIQVDVKDFSVCFEKISKAIIYFHRPGKVGKNIWANLTGGTNVLNIALIQAAYLSSFINKLYYTFVGNIHQDGKYLQPFSMKETEFDYREIYVLPTTYDQRYSLLLETLATLSSEGDWIASDDLFSFLKQDAPHLFKDITPPVFAREFLNVMPGVEINRGARQISVRITQEGKKLLELMEKPWFKALLHQTHLSDDELNQILHDLDMRKLE